MRAKIKRKMRAKIKRRMRDSEIYYTIDQD
jgi:hypothetical protein